MDNPNVLIYQDVQMSDGLEQHSFIFSILWKASNLLRHKIFFWLLLHDRVNTRNLLKRKSMFLSSYECALCNDKTEETSLHLFWDCSFSTHRWNIIMPAKRRGISNFDEFCLALSVLPKEFGVDIIIAGCWSIWSVRNDKIFKQAVAHPMCWKYCMREGLKVLMLRAKASKVNKIQHWLDNNL